MTDWKTMAEQAAIDVGHPNPKLFVRQMQQESGFSEDVIYGRRSSSAGAQGIAQFMPDTAKSLGVNPLDPAAALHAAARLMKNYYEQYGRWDTSLAAYNAGPGNVEKYGGVPPFEETQRYVKNILSQPTQAKAPKVSGRASLVPSDSTGGSVVTRYGESEIDETLDKIGIPGGTGSTPPATAPVAATSTASAGTDEYDSWTPIYAPARLRALGYSEDFVSAYENMLNNYQYANKALSVAIGKNPLPDDPGVAAARSARADAARALANMDSEINKRLAKPAEPTKPDLITQAGSGDIYERPESDLGPGQAGPPPPPRLVLPGAKEPPKLSTWEQYGSQFQYDPSKKTTDFSNWDPGLTPNTGVERIWTNPNEQFLMDEERRAAEADRRYKEALAANVGKPAGWRPGEYELKLAEEERLGKPPQWKTGEYELDKQKAEDEARKNAAYIQSLRDANEQSKNQLISSLADWQTKRQVESMPYMVDPSWATYPGFENTGPVSQLWKMGGATGYQAPTIPRWTVDPQSALAGNDAWLQAQQAKRKG